MRLFYIGKTISLFWNVLSSLKGNQKTIYSYSNLEENMHMYLPLVCVCVYFHTIL